MKSWTRNTCRPACMISEKAAAWGWAFQNRGNHLAAQTSTHLYLWPSDPLRPFVAHYTFCLGSGFASAAQKFSPLTILPDASGCLTFTLRGDGLDGVLYSRHLTRLFRERCGLSPKRLQRIVRINTAAMLMQRSAGLSLTRLAQELDYFDQAHFIHDFRAVCGVTPGAYQARLSDFYNEPLKF